MFKNTDIYESKYERKMKEKFKRGVNRLGSTTVAVVYC